MNTVNIVSLDYLYTRIAAAIHKGVDGKIIAISEGRHADTFIVAWTSVKEYGVHRVVLNNDGGDHLYWGHYFNDYQSTLIDFAEVVTAESNDHLYWDHYFNDYQSTLIDFAEVVTAESN